MNPLPNPQPTEDNPHVIEDYPYGFTLRCKMRVWVEYREGFGYRYFSQTSNPKKDNLVWNKPKHGTYNPFPIIVGTDDEGHTTHTAMHGYMEKDEMEKWLAEYGHCLTEDQKKAIHYFMVRRKWLSENTVWKVTVNPTDEERTESKEKEKQILEYSHYAAVKIIQAEESNNEPVSHL